jgi:hypothetical protein
MSEVSIGLDSRLDGIMLRHSRGEISRYRRSAHFNEMPGAGAENDPASVVFPCVE